MATHGKPMSRLQRSIDAPHRRLLSKLEEKWNFEEDRAMIKNKCCPNPEDTLRPLDGRIGVVVRRPRGATRQTYLRGVVACPSHS